ncbi:UDP-N-acetylglucosamine 2-epimerase (non-hydrolyzing) [Persicimonas caeni]|uniref:UDP-N-acetylglucosamine 2-epimerase (non-hydrolyzing) n=1 Tax=Persicimonas caeni TaxID=2292766 RepID=A0A4Y6Q2R0_PERCE|nr:UDP-N-acetylglucosamine 2-epimerase (non-hydrolyzing) [Persicimonas caeni]QED36103.1 UDP-N-acetylglucosamine 2-epimerase (non-hydrolyzing) [Persicimonas caeni]
MRVLTVFGTRPEAIKMAPLVRALDDEPKRFEQVVCVTAQHREMLDQVLELFEIQPDVDLDLMRENQDLTGLTCRILTGLRDVLADIEPDLVLVHGDTTTTFAASLASFYAQIPVGHIEAGLRTGDPYRPWPEELNRQLTDTLSAAYFAPTERARDNLHREGVSDDRLVVTGNTVIDALLWVRERLRALDDAELPGLLSQNAESSEVPERLTDFLVGRRNKDSFDEPMVLITGHRRENFGKGFDEIVAGIQRLSRSYPHVRFVYPVHLNPNVQQPVHAALADCDNVYLVPPMDYAPFVFLMDQATLILTDSGGIQEEAPSLGKPVLVMRDTTERPEAIEAGTARLVGASADRIFREVSRLIEDRAAYDEMARVENPFGDGQASRRICEFIWQLRQDEIL